MRPSRRSTRMLTERSPLTAGLIVAVWAVVAAVVFTGAAAPHLLIDPGPFVRWGLPIARLTANVAALLTVGALFLAAFILPAPGQGHAERENWAAVTTIAATSACLWTMTQAVVLVLSQGEALGFIEFADFTVFVTQTSAGAALAWAVILTAITAGASIHIRTHTGALGCLALAFASLVPLAGSGHTSSVDHELAVSGMWLHLSAVTIWLGALAVLIATARHNQATLPRQAVRYSVVAGWCFLVVLGSGLVNAWVQVDSLSALVSSRWGVLVCLKLAAFAVLGGIGWLHRRVTLRSDRLDQTRSHRLTFVRLASGELLLMAAILGVSAALGSSQPPARQAPTFQDLETTPGGGWIPPPPTIVDYVTQMRLEPVMLALCAGGAIVYLRWMRRLRSRGDSWSPRRAGSWLAGLALLAWLTSGGPAAYAPYLFSAHMAQHMAIVTVVPIFLVLGSPISLALRAIPRRADESRGPREWLLWVLHSPIARFFGHPLVASVNVGLSMVLFYVTPLFELAIRTHVGHMLAVIHFVFVGYLFTNILIGVDPGPRRPFYPARPPLLVPPMLFHAFFGLILIFLTTPLAGGHFAQFAIAWGIDPLTDQQAGGALAWALGEIPAMGLGLAIAMNWVSSEGRSEQRHSQFSSMK